MNAQAAVDAGLQRVEQIDLALPVAILGEANRLAHQLREPLASASGPRLRG